MLTRMLAVFNARNREFWRDRSSLSWNLAFPFLLVFGFYFIFGQGMPMFKVGVISDQDAYITKPRFMSLNHVQFVPYEDLDVAVQRVRRHQIDLLMDLDERRYWVNEESRNGYMAERLLVSEDPDFQRRLVRGEPIRYVDWVLPGIIGMNIMFSSLFGVGYAIVRYRKNGVLKRLKATPLSAFEFVGAQILSRLLMVLVIAAILFFGSHWALATLMLGSYGPLVLTILLGALAMISLGLAVASRTRSEELTGGLLNMATWPMMGLSEVWFSLEGAPESVHRISDLLPLTHLVSAAREITTEGATLLEVSDHLLTLAGMSAVFLLIAAALFNWDSDHR
ncbi:ABC transporter permease [Saccharospirillum salsuginis]|uniref:Transport permease protein n=1 Tax=Saccharospirillum salsuginis TaxID=418750 RepID=A0A918N690_9GAMM|nr:ABC transporter permease [Saccharospirillum salsuginis]GGX44885.1 transport permease protein [Saccharospirillum salsuginis]